MEAYIAETDIKCAVHKPSLSDLMISEKLLSWDSLPSAKSPVRLKGFGMTWRLRKLRLKTQKAPEVLLAL
jgi:hypothetical protein